MDGVELFFSKSRWAACRRQGVEVGIGSFDLDGCGGIIVMLDARVEGRRAQVRPLWVELPGTNLGNWVARFHVWPPCAGSAVFRVVACDDRYRCLYDGVSEEEMPVFAVLREAQEARARP